MMWVIGSLLPPGWGRPAEPTNQSGFRSIKLGIAVRHIALQAATSKAAISSSRAELAEFLKFVFRLPRHWSRMHDNQVWRSAVDGPVAFDRRHERPALNWHNPAAGAVEPIKGV
jgi:hypothetical protein